MTAQFLARAFTAGDSAGQHRVRVGVLVLGHPAIAIASLRWLDRRRLLKIQMGYRHVTSERRRR